MEFSVNRNTATSYLKSLMHIQIFLSTWLYLLCSVGLTFIPAASGRIASSSERNEDIALLDSISDFGTRRNLLPSGTRSDRDQLVQNRRRPRRSSADIDFHAFRKFLHSLPKARLNARLDTESQQIKRRNTALTMMERGSTGNVIASKVKCGGCQLSQQWIPVNKRGCRTNYVLAPTCMGMCETWEIPDIHPPYITTYHRVCRPTNLEYRKIRLRKCNPGVNNFYVMPIAQNCACTKCKSKNTACRPLL